MAVELLRFSEMDDRTAIQQAASSGLNSMEHFTHFLSQPQARNNDLQLNQPDCSQVTDLTVIKFKQVINLLNRTGHARFRRGPSNPCTSSRTEPLKPAEPLSLSPERFEPAAPTRALTLDFMKPAVLKPSPSAVLKPSPSDSSISQFSKECLSISPPMSSTNSSFLSSITGDGSVSNGKLGSSLFVSPAPAVSTGKPPLSSSHRKRCHEQGNSDDSTGKLSPSDCCHCSKRRKNRVKRTIRVPAISSKIADIPSDDNSWRKYGQKPIKGSPYPRGYYKCSTVKGCPARKHVERALDDPTMLIITYEGEHRHSPQPTSAGGGVLV